MHKFEIYLFKFNGTGNTQSGIRPAIVVQNNCGNTYSPTTIVCPLTSQQKANLPTHVLLQNNACGLLKPSTILCEQLFTVNKRDLFQRVGEVIDSNLQKKIDKALSISLGLTRTNPALTSVA